jgi:hypothetical protein
LKIFETPRDESVFVNLDSLTGTLVVKSDPTGATIIIDGQARSEKTPVTLTLTTGQHNIQIAKEGYKTYAEDLEIKDSVITNIDVNWASRKGT